MPEGALLRCASRSATTPMRRGGWPCATKATLHARLMAVADGRGASIRHSRTPRTYSARVRGLQRIASASGSIVLVRPGTVMAWLRVRRRPTEGRTFGASCALRSSRFE